MVGGAWIGIVLYDMVCWVLLRHWMTLSIWDGRMGTFLGHILERDARTRLRLLDKSF